MKTKYRLVSIVLLCFSPLLAAAPITLASDPALSGGQLVNFNNLALGSYTTINTDGVTLSNAAPITVPPIQGLSITNAAIYGLSSNGVRYSSSTFPVEPPFDYSHRISLKLDFNRNVSAFGFDLVSANYPYNLSAYDASDNLVESYDLPDFTFRNFYAGIKGNNTIRYALLTAIGEDSAVLDNLTIASQIPIPAAFWLFSPTLYLLTLIKRKQRITLYI